MGGRDGGNGRGGGGPAPVESPIRGFQVASLKSANASPKKPRLDFFRVRPSLPPNDDRDGISSEPVLRAVA